MDMDKIGKFISDRRRELGYTQDGLGEALGVSGKAVSKWERGLSVPDSALFTRIAALLKISIAELLDGRMTDRELSSNIHRMKEEPLLVELDKYETIDLTRCEYLGSVSPYLFGNNLEHTRSSVCGGLSAQMLKNRKFVGKPSAMEGVAQGWYVVGEKTYCSFSEAYTHHMAGHYHMRRRLECNAQRVQSLESGTVSGIGQHEICVLEGEEYEFAIVARSCEDTAVFVGITDRWGKNVYAGQTLNIQGGDKWKRYTLDLKPCRSDDDADLIITLSDKGCIDIGCTSLMNKNNFRGMRKDVIAAMKEMGIKLLRWPGGNFAGEYNWMDGLLDRDERAPFESYLALETQPHTLGYDFHEINTDDFVALCKEIGAEPFITINLAWNTPEENAAWVQYCNGDPNTGYGAMRAERGNPEPYNVMLWSLGNEFGYGHMEGDNSANGYSHLARENALMMLKECESLTLCSSGPYPSREWIEYSAKPNADIARVVSLHYYAAGYKYGTSYRSDPEIKDSYGRCISSVKTARDMVLEMRALLGDSNIKISFDEWNVWFGWYRPSSITDGMFAAMMMHMLICESERSGLAFACHFEAVNESAIKVTKKGAFLTATGQAISAMSAHANGRLLYAGDCVVATENDGDITMTVINPSYDETQKFSFKCAAKRVDVTTYEGRSMLPHTSFTLSYGTAAEKNGAFTVSVPAHSFAVLHMSK